jgi:hypothetical protein
LEVQVYRFYESDEMTDDGPSQSPFILWVFKPHLSICFTSSTNKCVFLMYLIGHNIIYIYNYIHMLYIYIYIHLINKKTWWIQKIYPSSAVPTNHGKFMKSMVPNQLSGVMFWAECLESQSAGWWLWVVFKSPRLAIQKGWSSPHKHRSSEYEHIWEWVKIFRPSRPLLIFRVHQILG